MHNAVNHLSRKQLRVRAFQPDIRNGALRVGQPGRIDDLTCRVQHIQLSLGSQPEGGRSVVNLHPQDYPCGQRCRFPVPADDGVQHIAAAGKVRVGDGCRQDAVGVVQTVGQFLEALNGISIAAGQGHLHGNTLLPCQLPVQPHHGGGQPCSGQRVGYGDTHRASGDFRATFQNAGTGEGISPVFDAGIRDFRNDFSGIRVIVHIQLVGLRPGGGTLPCRGSQLHIGQGDVALGEDHAGGSRLGGEPAVQLQRAGRRSEGGQSVGDGNSVGELDGLRPVVVLHVDIGRHVLRLG